MYQQRPWSTSKLRSFLDVGVIGRGSMVNWTSGARMSRCSGALAIVGAALVGTGMIANHLGARQLYAITLSLGLVVFPLLFVSGLLDHRRHRRARRREYELNAHSCPPGFFRPATARSEDLDAAARYAIYDVPTAREIGRISSAQLATLIRAQEDWGLESNDILIMPETVEAFEARGTEAELLGLLRKALSSRDEVELRWVRLTE